MSLPGTAQDFRRLTSVTANAPTTAERARMAAELSPGTAHPASRCPELSRREVEVLSYLPTMLTAGEIATELHVSVNTVKTHMKSIYGKLGVSRRRDAVTRAAEYRML
jgi:LuxR family maltose regulon positive regulatory protein